MPVLDVRTKAHARELIQSMRTIDPDGPSALSWVTAELPALLGMEKAYACVYGERGGGHIGLDAFFAERFRRGTEALFDEWVQRQPPPTWTTYHPLRPEPRQRNRVLNLAAILRIAGRPRDEIPVAEIERRAGIFHDDVLRILVCDGESLLAYVAAHQPDRPTQRQKVAFAAVLPALRRRLTLERRLAHGARTSAALDAALEAIGTPAFVVSLRGYVHERNASGEGRDLRRALADAVMRRPTAYALEIVPLALARAGPAYLVLLRGGNHDQRAAACVAVATKRRGLTARQSAVLARVLRGASNAAIAAELGVSSRAVEQHVTALFDRFGVESRAALVAAVLS